METSVEQAKRKQGQQLLTTEKMALTMKLVELLEEGYFNDSSLAQRLGVNPTTVRRYRPHADRIIKSAILDRNVIRNLQIKRLFRLVDGLTNDLEKAETVHEKHKIHSSIIRYCQHLSQISGISVEVHLHNAPDKLVIIRPPKIVQVNIDSPTTVH